MGIFYVLFVCGVWYVGGYEVFGIGFIEFVLVFVWVYFVWW